MCASACPCVCVCKIFLNFKASPDIIFWAFRRLTVDMILLKTFFPFLEVCFLEFLLKVCCSGIKELHSKRNLCTPSLNCKKKVLFFFPFVLCHAIFFEERPELLDRLWPTFNVITILLFLSKNNKLTFFSEPLFSIRFWLRWI